MILEKADRKRVSLNILKTKKVSKAKIVGIIYNSLMYKYAKFYLE